MARAEERDAAYRAVGRYVVEFSRLIFHMPSAITQQLAGPDRDSLPTMLALGEATASQIANAFFAMSEYVVSPDADELAIARRLQREVNEEIKKRNDVAHGDWWLGGFGRRERSEGGDPRLMRIKPTRRRGAFEARDIPVTELDKWSDNLYALRQLVAEFGDICLGLYYRVRIEQGNVRIGDIFVLRDNRVVREGPLASVFKPEYG